MDIGYLPLEHSHKMLKDLVPSMTWNGKQKPEEWQKDARVKLTELLGLNGIEKCKTELKMEIEYDKICEDHGCREIRFRFTTEENVTVPAHLLIPNGADKPLPVMIGLQGHSRGMHKTLGRVKYPQYEPPVDDGDRDFAVRAVKEGVCGIALEQRCFGESGSLDEGVPGCRQIAMRSILMGRTLVGERVWDIMRCIDVIQKYFTHIIDGEKIICLGNSGGGTATTYASALDERIKISVPSCAVCSYADSIGARYHCECNFIPHIAKYFDMGDLCAMVAPRAMVVVNGKDDTDFPLFAAKECVAVGRKVYDAMGVDEKLVHVVGGAGHRFYADDAWPHIQKALKAL